MPVRFAVLVVAVACIATSSRAQTSVSFQYNVRTYGAVGDGKVKDTGAIQRTIDQAALAGGGTVVLPAGTYLSGSLQLKNNIILHLEAGATLLGSGDPDDYPRTGKGDCFALICGKGLRNIGIVGRGTIDGQGDSPAFKITPPQWNTPPRPSIIHLIRCQRVRVTGVTLLDSPAWVQHYLECDDLVLDGLTVESHCNYNNDMIDIDGCQNVRVANCTGNTGDDALTLKSTTGRICENVTVSNCVFSSHANAIKCGTESRGGFRNITISNCAIRPARAEKFHLGERRGLGGVALEMVDGGVLERITISNIVIEGTTAPIFMRLGHCGRQHEADTPPSGVGTFRNVIVSNIVATGASKMGCAIAGLPNHPIENVTLSDIKITFAGGGTLEDVNRAIPERPDCYPECTMFGTLPAYGFYARHVTGLTLRNIDVRFDEDDRRPALFCDDVQNLLVNGLSARCVPDSAPIIVLTGVETALLAGCIAPINANVFCRLAGQTNNISVIGNDLGRAKTPFEFAETTPADVLFETANRRLP